jgi:ubiquinone/menaquinone biosynthesis C-methylase UbiE
MDHITTYLQDIEATPQSPIHILELGCGTGRSLDIFQDMYGEHFHYIGNDVASGMIIQAKKTYGGRNRREASSATRQWHT